MPEENNLTPVVTEKKKGNKSEVAPVVEKAATVAAPVAPKRITFTSTDDAQHSVLVEMINGVQFSEGRQSVLVSGAISLFVAPEVAQQVIEALGSRAVELNGIDGTKFVFIKDYIVDLAIMKPGGADTDAQHYAYVDGRRWRITKESYEQVLA